MSARYSTVMERGSLARERYNMARKIDTSLLWHKGAFFPQQPFFPHILRLLLKPSVSPSISVSLQRTVTMAYPDNEYCGVFQTWRRYFEVLLYFLSNRFHVAPTQSIPLLSERGLVNWTAPPSNKSRQLLCFHFEVGLLTVK